MHNKIESKQQLCFVGAIGAKQVPLKHGEASPDGPDLGANGSLPIREPWHQPSPKAMRGSEKKTAGESRK